jgi:hypothetical protein
VNFIIVVKIGGPPAVLIFFFLGSLGSSIPFEVVLYCSIDVMFDYDVFIRFRWQ